MQASKISVTNFATERFAPFIAANRAQAEKPFVRDSIDRGAGIPPVFSILVRTALSVVAGVAVGMNAPESWGAAAFLAGAATAGGLGYLTVWRPYFVL